MSFLSAMPKVNLYLSFYGFGVLYKCRLNNVNIIEYTRLDEWGDIIIVWLVKGHSSSQNEH